ncbi:MAG: hypothetical protein PHQ36_03265 [Anaerolineales bacterium]|nr:hypothetical protein [Anaerolineales bacterium]
MTPPKEPPSKVPPFVERQSPAIRSKVDTRGMLSLVIMLVSLAALSIALLGAGGIVYDVFTEGGMIKVLSSNLEGLLVKLIVLGFAFFFGWVAALVSIRMFGNLIYPIVINIYAWGCLVAVSALYLKVIHKLYLQGYDDLRFWAYLTILLGGLLVILFLHLLVEDHDLRPFAIPLLVISVIQLFAIVVRYVFIPEPDNSKIINDFAIFFAMIFISALMLAHLGIFSPLRKRINAWFAKNGGH